MFRHGRIFGGTLLALALMRSTAFALTACSAADIVAQDPGCPPGDGVCTITLDFETPDSTYFCSFDFRPRDVVIEGEIRNAESLEIDAGTLTVAPGGALRGLDIEVEATGDVWIQRQDRYVRGLISVGGGAIRIQTLGLVRIDGDLLGDATQKDGSSGEIYVFAGTGLVTGADSVISADGIAPPKDESYFPSGYIELDADGPVVLNGTVSAIGDGSDEGNLLTQSEESSVTINGRVRLDGWYAFQEGGTFLAYGSTGVTIAGKVTTVGGPTILGSYSPGDFTPSGEALMLADFGDVIVSGEVITDGVLYGRPGHVEASAGGNVVVSGRISAKAHRYHSSVAPVEVGGGERAEITGSIDLGNGSSLDVSGYEVAIAGQITGHIVYGDVAESDYEYFEAARVNVVADGLLRISGEIDLDSTGCGTRYGESDEICAPPWTIDISFADELEVTPDASIRAKGRTGGAIALSAERLTVAGDLDARGAVENGHVDLSATDYCSFTGTAQPQPVGLYGACANLMPTPVIGTPTPTTNLPTKTPTSTQTPLIHPECAADCNGNGPVDAVDLARIIDVMRSCPDSLSTCAVFSPEEACLTADLNRDDVISAGELTRILSWMMSGHGCP